MLQFLSRHRVEQVFCVYGQQNSDGEETFVLSAGDVFLNTQSYCGDDEVHATVHTECVVEGQQVFGETAAEQGQDHLCCDLPQG